MNGQRALTAAASLLLALLAAMPAQAAVSGTTPFEAEVAYRPLAANDYTVVSGRVDLAGATTGPFVATNVTMRIDALDQVCWDFEDREHGCVEGVGNLSIRASGDVAFRFPGTVGVAAQAAHHVGIFVDLQEEAFDGVPFAPSLAGSALDATLAVAPPPIPHQDLHNATRDEVVDQAGGVAALTAGSAITVYRDNVELVTVADGSVGFTGTPRVAPMVPDGWVIPFDGITASFERAAAEDTRHGLDVGRLQAFLAKVSDGDLDGLDGLLSSDALKEMLRGVILTLPPQDASGVDDLPLLALFLRLDAVGSDGVAVDGETSLLLRHGDVQDAQSLAGVWLVKLPWWAWLLWGLALISFALRVILKAPRHHERWDRLGWVGYAALAPVAAFVFWLWDAEWAHVVGTSAFTTGGSIWLLLLLQALTLTLVLGAVAWPLAIILRSGLMIARQGRFMNLGAPVAVLAAFLLGAGLVRAYLQLLLQEMPVG